MQLRKFLLRIMIWSLAAAAVLGAIAILTSGSDIIWRIAGTTVTTAVCAAALMAASVLLDKEKGRSAGLTGMAATLIAALLTFILIWDLEDLIPSRRPEETGALTIAFLFICAIPAMAFLRLRHLSSMRVAANAGVILTAVVFALLMVPTWYLHELLGFPSSNEWYASATATGLLGLLAVACLISIDHAKSAEGRLLTGVRIAGLAAAAGAWCIALYAIWAHIHESSGVLTSIISIACVVALANLALLVPLTPGQRWVRVGTIASAVLAAICVDILAFGDWSGSDEAVIRIGGAAGFVAACGSLALIIFARINRPMAGATREYREATHVSLTCPGCRSKQMLPVGAAACPTCHLRFNIRIDEPRCVQCDYLLFMLTGDRCPECGTPISAVPAGAAAPPQTAH